MPSTNVFNELCVKVTRLISIPKKFSRYFPFYVALFFIFLLYFKMSPAICFNLDQSKLLSSGNGLKSFKVVRFHSIIALKGQELSTYNLDIPCSYLSCKLHQT